MTTIFMPDDNFTAERKYIIDVFFSDFLGLKYKLLLGNQKDVYVIKLQNNNELVIKDHFFKNFSGELEYLSEQSIPHPVQFKSYDFAPEADIPILFGDKEFTVSTGKIICGLDIFASSFFMLSRWEEHVNPSRDHLNRFSAKDSIAYKNDFLHRPIVNEYVEFLWNMLNYLGINKQRKTREFKMIPTHDVDHTRYWNFKKWVKSVGGELVKRKKFSQAVGFMADYPLTKLSIKKDYHDTFGWLMDLSEAANSKSHFYFMSGGTTSYDNNYKIDTQRTKYIINEIRRRNHIIGFHPSFDAYNNAEQWKKEKQKLESVLDSKISVGRQHYLRFSVPNTWQIWENNGMKIDSTLSYADKEGFRCGTCYEFPVFNILTREKLILKEFPLIVMEGSFTTYQNITPIQMYEKTKLLLDTVKKYNGNFVYLWHNSSFNVNKWTQYKWVYEKILKEHTIY